MLVKVEALVTFSSVVWGNVTEGDVFEVDEGYVSDLEKWGMARRVVQPAPSVQEVVAELEAMVVTSRSRGRPRKS